MHSQPNTVGHPSTDPVTKFQVHLTFRLHEDAYDVDVPRPSLQEQADIMANAAVDIIREALGEQSDELLNLVEVSARGVV